MKYKVLFKKLDSAARLPKYAHSGDAGMDIFASASLNIPSKKSALVSTGLAIQLPRNTEAQIRPRSGLAHRNMVTLLNSPGTIDEGYRGEIKVIMINYGDETFCVKEGMKIAQLVIKPVYQAEIEEVNELDQSERGADGFGSTGE